MLVEKEYFDSWMQRIIQRLDRIEQGQKPPKAPKCMTLENGERLLDNFDLCRMLHVSKRTLQRYRSTGELPYQLLRQKTFYKETDVLRFIEANFSKFHIMKQGKGVLDMPFL